VALDLGIFWKLSTKGNKVSEIAEDMSIPLHRCLSLLDLLHKLGLLDKHEDTYSTSTVAQDTILNAYKADTWAFLANEAQRYNPLFVDLPSNLSFSGSLWEKQPRTPQNWFDRMNAEPEYAKRFTYALFDYHLRFAKKFAQDFDMSGVETMMDIGGGSGVMAIELLKRYSSLSATVIDIENVCIHGRKIAEHFSLGNRIIYTPLDFLKDDLPKNFDLILQCDAGLFSADFFSKLRQSLSINGRLVVVTNIDDDSAWLQYPGCEVSLNKFMKHFLHSLEIPKEQRGNITIESVKHKLQKAGFTRIIHSIWDKGEVIIEASP
jgi:hypothetical protein